MYLKQTQQQRIQIIYHFPKFSIFNTSTHTIQTNRKIIRINKHFVKNSVYQNKFPK